MAESNGKHIILNLEKRWKLNVLTSHFFIAVAITIVFFTLLRKIVLVSILWSVPVFGLVFITFLIVNKQWKVTASDVTGFLNRHFPQLEESAHLVLKPYESLNFLQKLQAEKAEQTLAQIPVPKHFSRKIISSLFILLTAFLISFILLKLPISLNKSSSENSLPDFTTGNPVLPNEKILPEIQSANIQIIPPAYTKKNIREQAKFNVSVEEGADVIWTVKTNVLAKKIQLLFNDKQTLSLRPLNSAHTMWSCKKSITKPGFYQVVVDNKISEFYRIETIKDLPPVINIKTPKSNTFIDVGMPEKVILSVALSDDYGIANTSVAATVSSGSGEAVKFKEQELVFSNFKAGNNNYNLEKLLDLKALGLQPGDQLYFYVKATDNHNQEKRSDVFIVSLADTAQIMSMDGLANGLDLKPEYFRSERQIIIETEQLLKDKDTISAQKFKDKSNDLGIDQKLLRLRYGKFLGEESETEIPGGKHEEAGQNEAADFGNADKIMDAYEHKHDNAEDATFFEPELKAQLKATLNEMWKAELQLRTNQPQDALPFEYKALRLLKDLQQKSRAYVAKTGFKATPLKPEKRLTGDLTKIIVPVNQQQADKKKDEYELSRKAAALLGLLQTGKEVSAESLEILKQASLQLYAKASSQPGVYLPAVSSMNKILATISQHNLPKITDINIAENGLQKLLSTPAKLPAAIRDNSAESLSDEYFKTLNKGKNH